MRQPRAGQGTVQIALRLPIDYRDRIKEAADASGRSMNSEILHRLQASLALDDVTDRAGVPQPSPEGLQAALDALSHLQAILKAMGIENDTLDAAAKARIKTMAKDE